MAKKNHSLAKVPPPQAARSTQQTVRLPNKAVKASSGKKPPASTSEDSSSEDEDTVLPVKSLKNAVSGKHTTTPSSSGGSSDSDSDSESESARGDGTAPKVQVARRGTETRQQESSSGESSDNSDAPSVSRSAGALSKAKQKGLDPDTSDSDSDSDSGSAKGGSAGTGPARIISSKATLQNGGQAADDSEDESTDSESDDDTGDPEEPSNNTSQPFNSKASKRKAEDTDSPAAKKTKTNGHLEASTLKTVWVGNLSWNVDDDWLRTEYETYGEVVSARVQCDRQSGKSRGFGYVEFSDAEAAAKAAADATKEIDGRTPRMDLVEGRSAPDPTKRAAAFNDQISEPSTVLFVGNLSFDSTEDGVWETFGEYGEVKGVRLPTDRETQAPKGFGYVEFATQEAATKAFDSLKGQTLFGRPIRLDYSHPRQNDGERSGRGGFRGRGGDRGGRGFDRGGGRGRGSNFRGSDRGRGRGFGSDRGQRGGGRGSRGSGAFVQSAGKKTTF